MRAMWYLLRNRTPLLGAAIILLFASSSLSNAQSPADTARSNWILRAKDQCVDRIAPADLAFKREALPKGWEKNSIVVLSNYARYFSYVDQNKPRVGQYSLTRILLQDEYALNDFSSFELEDDEYLEVKVIKKDDSEILLDRSREVFSDIYYTNGKTGKVRYFKGDKKIPVPNLEIGDILEIERYSEHVKFDAKGKVSFTDPDNGLFIIRFGESYPVFKMVAEFELSAPYELHWKAMNDAPVLIETGRNELRQIYRVSDQERPYIKGEFWSSRKADFPFLKVAYSKKRNKGKSIKRGTDELDPEWIYPYLNDFRKKSDYNSSGVIMSFSRELGEHYDKTDIAYRFYVFYRRKYYIEMGGDDLSNKHFVSILSRILDKYKVRYEWMVAIPKELGELKDLVSPKEIQWGIRVLGEDDIYSELTPYGTMSELDPSIAGTKALFINNSRSRRDPRLSYVNLPELDYKKNELEIKSRVNLDGYILELNREHSYSGFMRYRYARMMPHTLLYSEDYEEMYGRYYKMGVVSSYVFEHQNNLRKKLEDVGDRYWHDDLKAAEARLARYFRDRYYKIDDYEFYGIDNPARNMFNPTLAFSDRINAYGLVGFSDSTQIISIGRLLGETLYQMDQEDTLRLTGIDQGIPRTLRYEVEFNIGRKKKVMGLENLDTTIDNKSGKFTVRHRWNGRKLVVESEQIIYGNKLDPEQWDDVLAIVHAISETNRKKITIVNDPNAVVEEADQSMPAGASSSDQLKEEDDEENENSGGATNE